MKLTFFIEKLDEGFIFTQDGKKKAISSLDLLNNFIENQIKSILAKKTISCQNALISIEVDTNLPTQA